MPNDYQENDPSVEVEMPANFASLGDNAEEHQQDNSAIINNGENSFGSNTMKEDGSGDDEKLRRDDNADAENDLTQQYADDSGKGSDHAAFHGYQQEDEDERESADSVHSSRSSMSADQLEFEGADDEYVEDGGIPTAIDTAEQAHPQSTYPKAAKSIPAEEDVILLDDDSDEDEEGAAKRQKVDDHSDHPLQQNPPTFGALESYHRRSSSLPSWMKNAADTMRSQARSAIVPGQSLSGHIRRLSNEHEAIMGTIAAASRVAEASTYSNNSFPVLGAPPSASPASLPMLNQPQYFSLPSGHKPTWANILPPPVQVARSEADLNGQPKSYLLSLLNVNEFALSGLSVALSGFSVTYEARPTPISGLRVPIRQISRPYGRAEYEQDESGGKWRIPLGAYHAFVAYLTSLPNCRVQGIPQRQLQIASLERARQEKGYPTPEKLIEEGVPRGLATALAPFQRGGVDFVLEKKGRALIADDMGLGKTIQAIAAMAVYRDEWPVLVLTPSSARYHWEVEFQNWLGVDSDVCKPNDSENETEATHYDWSDKLLNKWQVNVLSSSRERLFPHPDTEIVVCSYGLAPLLVASGKIKPGMFRCAIVDESHMLKNKSSKRVQSLMPILSTMDRCILLSGTPALAQPAELWPQLHILQAERYKWWETEQDFVDQYVKRGGSREKAELHTMLTSTVMIRRLKVDILKSMPTKRRAKALLHVLSNESGLRFQALLEQLRLSKGQLGKLAREHHAQAKDDEDTADQEEGCFNEALYQHSTASSVSAQTKALDDELQRRFDESRQRIDRQIAIEGAHLDPEQRRMASMQGYAQIRSNLDHERRERLSQMDEAGASEAAEGRRTNLLSQLYALTGDVKVTLIVDMLKRWLRDPTKGKLCIFAHHISVLDALQNLSMLSNAPESKQKYIRIDGSTSPKCRQEQISAFQTDPFTKVALLGITAAGVAVTLTASSTVWFAELFWTPAIMIQAEDRCHRIGQNSRVNCLYFVAKGTLDEVLWKLIEKKFRELGEFVEGKEKLKLVVDTVYTTQKELHSMFEIAEENEDDEIDGSVNEFDKLAEDLQLDSDLVHDIELLGEEEQRMLNTEGDEADADSDDAKMPAVKNAQGTTEEEAICLADSDDEDNAEQNDKGASSGDATIPVSGGSVQAAVAAENEKSLFDSPQTGLSLTNCRVYKILIGGPSLGLSICLFEGRIVVAGVLASRVDHTGQILPKPSLGDILVSFNGQTVPVLAGRDQFQTVCQSIRQSLLRPPIELVFAEDNEFVSSFAESEKHKRAADLEKRNSQAANNIIELIDDD